MKLKCIVLIFLMATISLIHSENIIINRDKTLLKSGPGCFYDNLLILRINTVLINLGPANEDDGWLKVLYRGVIDNKREEITGYISRLAISERKTTSSPFESLKGDVNEEAVNQIAPGAYTAAIKGFLANYTVKHRYNKYAYDDIYSCTNFTKSDYVKVLKETKLSYFPRNGELLGVQDTFITEKLEAISAAITTKITNQWDIEKVPMGIETNVIANILNRQTVDYDKRYYVWIIKNSEPVAFSGPGGIIFISSGLIDTLGDYRELVAVIAHEVGHIAMRHGIRDLSFQLAREAMDTAFDELDADTLSGGKAALSNELESLIDEAVDACSLVRDDKEEFEADEIAMELLRRYRIDKKYLALVLSKTANSLSDSEYATYKQQIERRLAKIK